MKDPFIPLALIAAVIIMISVLRQSAVREKAAGRLQKTADRASDDNAEDPGTAAEPERKPAPSANRGLSGSGRDRSAGRKTPGSILPDRDGFYDGSLYADDGTEGRDPNDPAAPSLEAADTSPDGRPASAPRSPILPEFTGGNLARAFVMQEILKRPNQRR